MKYLHISNFPLNDEHIDLKWHITEANFGLLANPICILECKNEDEAELIELAIQTKIALNRVSLAHIVTDRHFVIASQSVLRFWESQTVESDEILKFSLNEYLNSVLINPKTVIVVENTMSIENDNKATSDDSTDDDDTFISSILNEDSTSTTDDQSSTTSIFKQLEMEPQSIQMNVDRPLNSADGLTQWLNSGEESERLKKKEQFMTFYVNSFPDRVKKIHEELQNSTTQRPQ